LTKVESKDGPNQESPENQKAPETHVDDNLGLQRQGTTPYHLSNGENLTRKGKADLIDSKIMEFEENFAVIE